jgi:hypothetical protein
MPFASIFRQSGEGRTKASSALGIAARREMIGPSMLPHVHT